MITALAKAPKKTGVIERIVMNRVDHRHLPMVQNEISDTKWSHALAQFVSTNSYFLNLHLSSA